MLMINIIESKDLTNRRNAHLRKGKRAGRFANTMGKLNNIRKIVSKFGGIAKLLSVADYIDDIRSCISFCKDRDECE